MRVSELSRIIATKRNALIFLPALLLLTSGFAFFVQSRSGEQHSVWNEDTKPKFVQSSDERSIELGVKFKSSIAGKITGIKFYKSAGNTGTHTGTLWKIDGTKLSSVAFTNESASGWQTATFAQPIAIEADTVYVASYHAPNGGYSVDEEYFTKEIKNGPLTMLASTPESPNGVFSYSNAPAFPTQSYKKSNYWVDVLFDDGAQPKNARITSFSATPDSILAGSAATLTWDAAIGQSCTINNGVGSVANKDSFKVSPSADTTYRLTCKGFNGGFPSAKNVQVQVGSNAAITSFTATPGNIKAGEQTTLKWSVKLGNACSIDNGVGSVPNTGQKTVQPNANTTYILTCQGTGKGNSATAQTIVVVQATTNPAPTITTSLWSDSDLPNVAATGDDTAAVELGVKFRSSQTAVVKAIKFYKGAGNTGTHIGNLWTVDGIKLATVTFANESESGWQTAQLASPVNIAADTTYIVSYHAPNGRYAITANYFNLPHTNGILTALQDSSNGGNGVFRYGGSGFPTSSWNASNYWVDVVVESTASTTPPQVPAPTGRVPWEGGPAYWSSYEKASLSGWTNPNFFPISVFFGKADPSHVASLKDAGVNTYMAVEYAPDIFP